MQVIKLMKDTDYLVYLHNKDKNGTSGSGHVIISYNGGFVESKGKDSGCVFTNSWNALNNLNLS